MYDTIFTVVAYAIKNSSRQSAGVCWQNPSTQLAESADKEMSIIHAGNMTKLDQTNTSQIIYATFNVAIPRFIFHKFPHPIPFKMYVPQSHQVKE